MRRALLLVALLLVVTASPPVAARSLGGWKAHRGQGFSIALPSSWADASNDRERILAESRRLVAEDPELSRIIDGLLAAGAASAAVKMFAFDLAPSSLESGFATNLNVIREQTSLSFAEWRAEAMRALSDATFVQQPIWSQPVKLPAGKALRISYKARFTIGKKQLVTSIVQFGLVRPGFAYVLTYTTVPKLLVRYRPTFDRSARSFRLR